MPNPSGFRFRERRADICSATVEIHAMQYAGNLFGEFCGDREPHIDFHRESLGPSDLRITDTNKAVPLAEKYTKKR